MDQNNSEYGHFSRGLCYKWIDFKFCSFVKNVKVSNWIIFIDKIKSIVFIYRATRRWLGKRANLKTGVKRKQSMSSSPKNEHFLLPDSHTWVCVLGGKKY